MDLYQRHVLWNLRETFPKLHHDNDGDGGACGGDDSGGNGDDEGRMVTVEMMMESH